jgi:hypothetical protein
VIAVVLLAALLAAGCAANATADKAATLALEQLTKYETDVALKIRAENDYYDEVTRNAVARINRLRADEQDSKLAAFGRAFAERNAGAGAESVATSLPDLFDSAIEQWAAREEGYEQLLARSTGTLADSRKRLEMEQAKIRELKTKLQALREPGTTLDMLKLAIAFGKEVKEKFDAGKAAETSTGGTR